MNESTTSEQDIKNCIETLKAEKHKLIKIIKNLEERIRYKEYEQKALEPFLEQTKNIKITPLRKLLNQLEFKISTQAYTPKIEKDLIKEVKHIEKELSKTTHIEKSRKRMEVIKNEIKEDKERVENAKKEFNRIQEELNINYKRLHDAKKEQKRIDSHFITLEEAALFNKEEKTQVKN